MPAAAPGPRDYTHDTLFPAVREMTRRTFGLEVFTHALFTPNTWPPTAWSHDRFARGSYSYALPGCFRLRAVLAAPVDGRLFFAGEATSPGFFSTAHGAHETGLRAAAEVTRSLSPV